MSRDIFVIPELANQTFLSENIFLLYFFASCKGNYVLRKTVNLLNASFHEEIILLFGTCTNVNEKIWGKCQRDCTSTTRKKTEKFKI